MKSIAISAVSVALLLVGHAVQAQEGPLTFAPRLNLGADVMLWELDREDAKSADSTGLRLRGGLAFNDYFAVEGHLGTGGSDRDVELDDLVGLYARLSLPLGSQFRLFGLAGATQVELGNDEENDTSYGGGAELNVTPDLVARADYIRYLDEDTYTFDAGSVGLTYHF